jgi:hypothetical protein
MKEMVEAALAAHIAQLQAQAARAQHQPLRPNGGDIYVKGHVNDNGTMTRAYTRRRKD